MDIEDLNSKLGDWRDSLDTARKPDPEGWTWYGYDAASNIATLNGLFSDETKQELKKLGKCTVADIGCADGDVGLLLSSEGYAVDLIDWPATNWNGLRGAALLKERLNLDVSLSEIDLDSQFRLPREQYGFILLLGILYHLKNPYYVLEQLAKVTQYCAISTRVAKFARAAGSDQWVHIEHLPVAYLVDTFECNNDATNFWIFSTAGLQRIVNRAGWEIIDQSNLGAEDSNPADNDKDERCYMLLKSRML